MEKNSSLEKANARIDQLNSELADAKLKLRELNREMESFSYSVSHDLRAPLRALLGYSEILWEDYGSSLDEEAQELIGKIRQGGHRMERLIQDLLMFFRIGKAELSRSEVDMKVLVEKAVGEAGSPAAKIKIGPLRAISGDPSLLQQVWTNLVSNAVKYSSKKPLPVVEISCEASGNTVTYAIKDNGAGFDMKYAGKLFGVFQRLHSNKEFDGTGIGLATVQRIIKKHGGSVWAEAKENEGATFFFSLPATA